MYSLKVLVAGIGAALLATCTPFHSGSQSGTPGARPTPTWGALPTPLFHSDYAAVPSWSSAPEPDLYTDPVTITWSGKLNLSITNAPVFRYSEPTFAEANRFATGLHATPESDTRSSGRSWSYGNSDEDFRVVVIGSADARGTGPTYLIFPAPDTPVEPASVGPLNRAMTFLNGHHLLPEWTYRVVTQAGATQSAAIFERQFD